MGDFADRYRGERYGSRCTGGRRALRNCLALD